MAKAISPATGQSYGIGRVCPAWGVPRSSVYAADTFAARYTTAWLVEKNGFQSSLDIRAAWLNTYLSHAASSSKVSRKPGAI